MTMHPASCKNPDTCDLSYVEHLRGFVIGVDAIPSRAVTRNKGMDDEPSTVTRARERRMSEDMPAYRRLRADGLHPRSVRGAARV
jgi:hypothetical protein